MDNLLIDKKMIEKLKIIYYHNVEFAFRYFLYNEIDKLESVKKFFDFVSKITIPSFKNIYLVGERYEGILNNMILNISDYTKEQILAVVTEGYAMIYEAIDDLEYLELGDNNNKNLELIMENFLEPIIKSRKNDNNRNMKEILILDDDYEILQMMDMMLPKYGYKLFLTTNSSKIYEIIKNNNLDLVILDFNMPRKNGLEVAKDIKRDFSNIPFMFFSANSDEKVIMEAEKLGAKMFLKKPSNEETLINGIKKCMIYKDKIDNSKRILENEVQPNMKVNKLDIYEESIKDKVENENIEISNSNGNSKLDRKVKINKTLEDIRVVEEEGEKSKVLIVDGEKIVVRLIKSRFKMDGIYVDTANTFKDIFKKCVTEEYSVVIVDVNLKGENIFEIIKGLKLNPITKNINIIVLTSVTSEQVKEECYNMGADDYVLKPFSVKELQVKVMKLLEIKNIPIKK